MLGFFDSPEKRIRREIRQQALKIAEENYKRDVAFRSLTSSDLHYAILYDLIKTAQFTGKVELTLKDGVKILIEDKEARARLNDSDDKTQLF